MGDIFPNQKAVDTLRQLQDPASPPGDTHLRDVAKSAVYSLVCAAHHAQLRFRIAIIIEPGEASSVAVEASREGLRMYSALHRDPLPVSGVSYEQGQFKTPDGEDLISALARRIVEKAKEDPSTEHTPSLNSRLKPPLL